MKPGIRKGDLAVVDNRDETPRPPAAEDIAIQAAEQMLGPNPFIGLRATDILATLQSIGRETLTAPGLAVSYGAGVVSALLSIMSGASDLVPAKGDRRFTDAAWNDNPIYRAWLQAYLAWGKALERLVDGTSLDELSKQRARFVISLLTDAVAPTNTLLGNPAALKKVVDTGGKSLFDGYKNLLADFSSNRGMPSQVDMTAFQPGRNLALSQGAVVWKNDVLELIQYMPATDEVRARPQLIVPPQINKFYIFDLAPGKSIVEYLLKSGFQVFIVSWRNPTTAHRHWSMDTYVSALLEAIAAMREITGAEDVNLHAACSGAMTVAALLGHLAAKRERLINAAALMVAVLDTEAESTLGLFTTPESIEAAKMNSRLKGVLEGAEMASVFSWMRPNDLVWNYWVNNYLMGNPPPTFDVLYWNNDTTRLPAAFHAQLLDIFAGRLLQEPGGVKILGTPIALAEVDIDKLVVAGVTDHITPWKGVYKTGRMFGGNSEFILSSSGHIQSLVNPPGNPKSRYFLGSELPASPDSWLATAKEMSGTWWDRWRDWIAERSGEMRPAPTSLGSERHRPGAKAPGTYVGEP